LRFEEKIETTKNTKQYVLEGNLKAPKEIESLVNNFKLHEESLKHSHYSETSLCADYLNPLFEALGWDVLNKSGYSESYRDVIQQFRQKVGSSNKAPDYLFRTGATPVFFLEAKKPSVNILTDKSPAYQLRTYGWNNKGVDISILSDFEHLAIYDVRIKPKDTDEPHVARLVKFHYIEFVEKWDQLYGLLARESICKGSLEKLLKEGPTKGTKETVDESFLKVIESWREELAKNIANRNPSLTVHELNKAVQMTIDRIVFLRNCEDRNIEPPKQLLRLINNDGIYKQLLTLFEKADTKYNSGLFHFKNDKTRQTGKDELTPNLTVDDKTLKVMIEDLYPPKNPFDFSIMPVDILGQVYERFLGKVIRLTDSHRAKVEEKPEVRKAGGVYYTPKYIVDYIIKNTVGKLVEGKTPDQVAKLRILDPACGSGSFLLGAYQYLLSWHLDWYTANDPKKFASKKKSPPICEITGGWKLTTEKRKEILLNNIYGVDIDRQAVEVAKLNLLLKVLEDQEVSLGMERALPDLGENIKCGNSLIGTDFYDDKQSLLTDPEERYRINAFDWEVEFPQIVRWKDKTKRELEDGYGFDGVVGNPPYIRIQTMKEWAPDEVDFYKTEYKSASKGNYDIYVVFVEQGLGLLSKAGRLGFILPHKFFNSKYGESVRDIISNGNHLSKVVHFGDEQVFNCATTYTCLLFLDGNSCDSMEFSKVTDIKSWETTKESETGMIPSNKIGKSEWNFVIGKGAALFDKLNEMPVKLGDVASRIFQGLITGADKVFILSLIDETKRTYNLFSKALGEEIEIEKHITKKLAKGDDISRYSYKTKNVIIFPYARCENSVNLLSESTLMNDYPNCWEYFKKCETLLKNREGGKWNIPEWWQYGRNQNIFEMTQEKIVLQVMSKYGAYSLDETANVCIVGGGNAGGYGISVKQGEFDQKYLLGLLNSKLLNWYIRQISTQFRGGYYSYARRFIEHLPIYSDIESNGNTIRHKTDLTQLVNSILQLNKSLSTATLPEDKKSLKRLIDKTDRDIDNLVYELYGLSDKEIQIIEDSME